MSLARVKTVKAAKEYACEKCQATISKGDQYRWYKVGFRSRYRHIRCVIVMQVPSVEVEDRLGMVVAAWNEANPSAPIEVDYFTSMVLKVPVPPVLPPGLADAIEAGIADGSIFSESSRGHVDEG